MSDPQKQKNGTADGAQPVEEKYVTDLDFISNWDEIHYEPSDVYANGMDALFESGAFDTGEEYPRGV